MSMREHHYDVEMSDEESPMYMHLQWSYSCMHDNVNNPLLYNYLFVMVAYELLSYWGLHYHNRSCNIMWGYVKKLCLLHYARNDSHNIFIW